MQVATAHFRDALHLLPFLEAFLDVEAGQPIPEAENVGLQHPSCTQAD